MALDPDWSSQDDPPPTDPEPKKWFDDDDGYEVFGLLHDAI